MTGDKGSAGLIGQKVLCVSYLYIFRVRLLRKVSAGVRSERSVVWANLILRSPSSCSFVLALRHLKWRYRVLLNSLPFKRVSMGLIVSHHMAKNLAVNSQKRTIFTVNSQKSI